MKQEQQEKQKIENNYRYPGSRPFNDTDLDRSLFFGREEEKQRLFHHILVENLFVLFSKSGMGKTSLLNAGLKQMLRDRDFLPMSIRFNDRDMDPLKTVYAGIEEAVEQRNEQVDEQNKIDYETGELNTLWQFFKTAAFWIYGDVPLTPILIFDQFEEFFTMHAQEEREEFIAQLADLVRGRVPKTLRKTFSSGTYGYFPYSNTAPKVKIVISIREDYLGHLDEMKKTIPGILRNCFRLLPLKCHKAKDAIIKPAQLSGDEYKHVRSKGFSYEDETVEEMLDFLCERREMGEIIKTDEVEPFQLQLLCRHIEEKVRQKSGRRPGVYKVWPGDLGGKTGMKKVLQEFYEDRIKVLTTPWKRRKVRKLCEKGLIFKKRRSLMDERRIIRKYKVSKALLSRLVDNRLLRSERREGRIFYELSHDTFVKPILESRRRRKIKQAWMGVPVLLIIVIVLIVYQGELLNLKKKYFDIGNYYEKALIYKQWKNYNAAIDEYYEILKIDKKRVSPYIEIGKLYVKLGKPDDAINICSQAVKVSADYAHIYMDIALEMKQEEMEDELETLYQEASEVETGDAEYYVKLGDEFYDLRQYDRAIKTFEKAIVLDPKNTFAWFKQGMSYRRLVRYKDAIWCYKKAIEYGSTNARTFYMLGFAYGRTGNYKEAIKSYNEALRIDPGCIIAEVNLAEVTLAAGKFKEAYNIANVLLNEKRIYTKHKLAVRFILISSLVFQNERSGAHRQINDFIEYYKTLSRYRVGDYTISIRFIKKSSLEEGKKNFLLSLIKILESPEKAGDEELKELEQRIKEIFKDDSTT